MTTRERIAPILHETYGKGSMVDALADQLAERIDGYSGRDTHSSVGRDGTRESMIRETCWNWFSGGDTAWLAAKKIEAALEAKP